MPRYIRKVIRVRAEDSPNVQLGLEEAEAGLPITYGEVIPGVLSYMEYLQRRETWDPIRQCIGLDGTFYEGAEFLLYPPEWLNLAERAAVKLQSDRRGKCMGVDSAMGGDNTSWAIVDEKGLIELIGIKTPDTTEITSRTIASMGKWGVEAKNVLFDYGGGGKDHADRLRRQGYAVRTVGFGESAKPERRRIVGTLEQRKREDEIRYAYKNRRAEMYGILRQLLEPREGPDGLPYGRFGLPHNLVNRTRLDGGPSLRAQLAPIPYWLDEEGRMFLPSKNRRPDHKETVKKCLTEMIGCSPDEADALVLAVFGLTRRGVTQTAGAVT